MSKKNTTPEEYIESHSMWKKGQVLLFDINPSDNHQYWMHKVLHQNGRTLNEPCPVHKRILKFEKYWTHLLKDIKGISVFKINLEISHEGRIHLHTMLTLKEPFKFCSWFGSFKFQHQRKFMYKLDTVSDIKFRRKYMEKDTEQFLKELEYTNKLKLPSKHPTITSHQFVLTAAATQQ